MPVVNATQATELLKVFEHKRGREAVLGQWRLLSGSLRGKGFFCSHLWETKTELMQRLKGEDKPCDRNHEEWYSWHVTQEERKALKSGGKKRFEEREHHSVWRTERGKKGVPRNSLKGSF